MSDHVTRCPNCDTSFVVTEAQLAAADGAVRCGACLQVFMAQDYFVQAPIADLFDDMEPEAPEPSQEPEDEVILEELLGPDPADHLEEGSGTPTMEGSRTAQSLETAQSLKTAQSSETWEFSVPEVDHEIGATAELVQIDETVETAEVETNLPTEVDDSLENLETGEVASEDNVLEDDVLDDALDETALLDETRWETSGAEDQVEEALTANGLLSGLQPESDPEIVADLDQALDQVVDDASDIVPEYHEAPMTYRLRWFAAVVLLGSALSLQHLWFERNTYAANADYRIYYEKFCNAVGCELEPFSDVSRLTTQNLVVRTHPEIAGGLVVDALLRNEAGFRQPFPGLYLRFADISGKTIADRTFLPNLYLAGEMAGLKFIPAATEVRLSLEIVDPGNAAVSYSLVAVTAR